MSRVLYPSAPVLIVDDEVDWLHHLQLLLQTEGITNVITCKHSSKVRELLLQQEISAVALDLNMPEICGEKILQMMQQEFPGLKVIIITGMDQIETAVNCMKLGACDYFVKSTDSKRLIASLQRLIEMYELVRENRRLKENFFSDELKHPQVFSKFITKNKKMLSTFQYMEVIATTYYPVLVTGETGVGKEIVARAIHELSGRSGKFVAVNSAGLDENIFADTLFGHKKGAFTGAYEKRLGVIEQARGGTLFLDEIGDMAANSQLKLLRLLQEHEYTPLGSDIAQKTDARIVVATNQNLAEMSVSGRFRKDLFFRLSTHTIQIEPLRKRRDDIPYLLDYFLQKASNELGKPKPTPPPQLYTLLKSYHFPGNVRELKSMVFDAVSCHSSRTLSMKSFQVHMQQMGQTMTSEAELKPSTPQVIFSDPLPNLQQISQILVCEAMKRAEGNQSIAAKMLGISRQALNRRLSQIIC